MWFDPPQRLLEPRLQTGSMRVRRMSPLLLISLRRPHDGREVDPHFRWSFCTGIARARRRGEPAVSEQAFPVAYRLRGRQPAAERLYEAMSAGIGTPPARGAERRYGGP